MSWSRVLADQEPIAPKCMRLSTFRRSMAQSSFKTCRERANEAERDRRVRSAIVDHYQSAGGHVPTFGRVVGYVLVLEALRSVDIGIPYDVTGARLGPMIEVQRLGAATLTIKGKPIPASFFAP